MRSLEFKENNRYIKELAEFISDYIKKDTTTKELGFILNEGRASWKYQIRRSTVEEVSIVHPNLTSINKDDYLSVIIGGQVAKIIEIPLIVKKLNPEGTIKLPLIPFGQGYGKDLALTYFEMIEKSKSTRLSFLSSIKNFVPNIERILVNTEDGEIHIEEEGFDEAASLHQFGEGANKLFRILTQITLQKGKRLLIDEIDAGIHYSHFSDFWKTILSSAKDNNVQIFATTHNIECVKYFKDILVEESYKDLQDDSRIITLRELPDRNIKAYTRVFDEFQYELDNDLELRGGEL